MSDLADRPLVTFALFAGNQEQYIWEGEVLTVVVAGKPRRGESR